MWCCGERSKTDSAEEQSHVQTTDEASKGDESESLFKKFSRKLSSIDLPHSECYASLLVNVESAEGLIGVDFARLDLSDLHSEYTLDAFARLSINHDHPFAKTETQWNSSGNARWDENHSVGLAHPQSFLRVDVYDDDQIFGQDGLLPKIQLVGWIEIPLSSLPRNRVVSGWFKLHHPDHMDESTKEIEEKKKLAKKQHSHEKEKLESEAGYIKLQLLVKTSAFKEFLAGMKPAPVFNQSVPPLDVPQFLEDIQEIKRMVLERLILRPISCFLYAISWDYALLSLTLLCWHVFVCYYKEYVSASLWIVFLLCFWHEIPPQKNEEEDVVDETVHDLGEGVMKGATHLAKEAAAGVTDAVWKPIEGAQKGGVVGLARGMKDGLTGNIAHTANAWQGMAQHVGKGVGASMDSLGIHGIGLQEIQHFLRVKPAYANMIRNLQPTAHSIRHSLQQVDDIFYWANFGTTKTLVIGVTICLLLSILLGFLSFDACRSCVAVLSGYGHLVVGSLLLVCKAPMFGMFVSAVKSLINVCCKSKEPFKRKPWFKLG